MNSILKDRNLQSDIQSGINTTMNVEENDKENFNPKSLKEITKEVAIENSYSFDLVETDKTVAYSIAAEEGTIKDDVIDPNEEEQSESFMSTNDNLSFLIDGFNNMRVEGSNHDDTKIIKVEMTEEIESQDNIAEDNDDSQQVYPFDDIEQKEIEEEDFKVPLMLNKRSTEQFQTGITYNFGESDFDFLQKFGTAPVADIPGRDSVLLKFDPLLEKVNPIECSSFSNSAVRLPITKEEEEDFSCEKEQLSVNENSIISPNLLSSLYSTSKNKDGDYDDVAMKELELESQSVEIFEEINKSEEDICISEQHIKEEESTSTMTELESQIRKEAELMEEALLKRISEKDKQIAKMNNVVEAYEKAIAELIAEKEQLIQNYDKKCIELRADSETNSHHLASLESTFSDLHAKYERTKQIASELKEREEMILQDRKTLTENLKVQEQRYEKMKMHAMTQLEIANNKLAEMSRNHQAEVTKLKAQLKKEEISRASINEQLIQKSKENAELVKICDELIGNHGHSQNA